jgi:DCN1-like protein 1/2
LTSEQKEAIETFKMITGTSTKVAQKFLEQNAWKVDHAINSFYNSGGIGEPTQSTEELEKMFKKYQEADGDDEEENKMQFGGIIKFCEDLGIDPESDVLILIIACLIGAKDTYTFTKQEFVDGMEDLGCFTLKQMKDQIQNWRKKIFESDEKFKDFYKFVFTFSTSSKTLLPDVACALWKLILSGKYKHLDLWIKFLNEEYKKPITKDTWNQFLDFTRNVDEDFSNYDQEDGWPSVIDEFVAYAQEEKK